MCVCVCVCVQVSQRIGLLHAHTCHEGVAVSLVAVGDGVISHSDEGRRQDRLINLQIRDGVAGVPPSLGSDALLTERGLLFYPLQSRSYEPPQVCPEVPHHHEPHRPVSAPTSRWSRNRRRGWQHGRASARHAYTPHFAFEVPYTPQLNACLRGEKPRRFD